MRNAVKVALLLVLGLALAYAAESGNVLSAPNVDQSLVSSSGAPGTHKQGPRPPTDDSTWVKVDSVSVPASDGLIGIDGNTIWRGTFTTLVERRNRFTGALVSSFNARYGNVADVTRFGDSLLVTYYNTICDVYDTTGVFARSFTMPVGIHGVDWDGSKFWMTDNNSPTPRILTVSRTGTVLRTLTGSGVIWLMDIAVDRKFPNRLWSNADYPSSTNYIALTRRPTRTRFWRHFQRSAPSGTRASPTTTTRFLGGCVYLNSPYDGWLWRMRVHDNGAPPKVMVLHADGGIPDAVWALAGMLRDSSGGTFAAVDTYDLGAHPTFPATDWVQQRLSGDSGLHQRGSQQRRPGRRQPGQVH